MLLILIACAPVAHDFTGSSDTGVVDSAADSAADSDIDTDTAIDTAIDTAPCALTSVTPSSTAWGWPATPTTVGVHGCANPLTVVCPVWVQVSGAPATVDGDAWFTVGPAPGYSAGQVGACDVNGWTIAVEILG